MSSFSSSRVETTVHLTDLSSQTLTRLIERQSDNFTAVFESANIIGLQMTRVKEKIEELGKNNDDYKAPGSMNYVSEPSVPRPAVPSEVRLMEENIPSPITMHLSPIAHVDLNFLSERFIFAGYDGILTYGCIIPKLECNIYHISSHPIFCCQYLPCQKLFLAVGQSGMLQILEENFIEKQMEKPLPNKKILPNLKCSLVIANDSVWSVDSDMGIKESIFEFFFVSSNIFSFLF
jgi:hypothetical protein